MSLPFRLKPSAFDAARPLLDRVQPRGWIWQGHQKLDGLCCLKDWFEDEGWTGALTPWLDHAAAVRESESAVILDFEKPLECDCAALGRVLPLRRTEGALTSFPFVLSAGSGAVLADHLLIIDQGERIMSPLSAFRPVDIAGWWDFADIEAEESAPVPSKPWTHAEDVSSSITSFDPEGFAAGLEEVSERLSRRSRNPARFAGKLAFGILGGLARIVAWLMILGFILGILGALAGSEGKSDIWGHVVAFAFAALYLLFVRSKKLVGPPDGNAQGQGRRQGQGASPIAMPDHRFGFFRRAAGWLFWNSALASGARDKYSRRLRELEALFERGRLDEALRKGIALGTPRKKNEAKQKGWFADFPLGGPGMRKNLNIRLQLGQVPSFGILTGAGFEQIRELYRKQAEALTERGDYERAAFIYAELLNDAAAAVRVFERKGDFLTAAKLAQGRRLPPSLFIPLWFKAGEKSRALRLAVQYDAFTDLVAHVKQGDPFLQEVVIAWSMRLAETGDVARALELTEKYAQSIPERRDWLLRGLDREPLDAVLLARGLRCLGDDHQDRLRQLLDRCVTARGGDHAGTRVMLASRMADAVFEKAATDTDYFPTRLPLLAMPLLRALLRDEAEYGSDKQRRDAALALCEAAGQFALRVDLRRLNRVTAAAAPPPPKHIVMGEVAGLTQVCDAVSLAGNRLLVAYANGALHLLTHDGRRLWSDHVYGVRGFAPIGAGTMVLIVRDEIEGPALSLLDTEALTHRDIGFVDIGPFHSHATEIGWMVFANGQVCLLDTAALIAAARKGGGGLTHHWAVPMTEPGRVCAFRDHPTHVTFLYQRKLGGLLELWTLYKSNLQVECRFINKDQRVPRADVQTFAWVGGSYFRVHQQDQAGLGELGMPTVVYSLADERRLLKEKAGWLLPDQSISTVSSSPPPAVWCTKRPEPKSASVPTTKSGNAGQGVEWFGALTTASQGPFSIAFPGAARVDAHMQTNAPVAAVYDDLGRLALVNLERRTVLFRNDGR
jgi:hypothetical protein